MAPKKNEPVNAEPEARKPRELMSVAEELPTLVTEAFRTLEQNWNASVNGGASPDPLHRICFRYGQHLGELNVPPEQFLEGLENQIDGLVERTLQTSDGDLGKLEAKIKYLQEERIPELRRDQGRIEAEIASLHKQVAERPFYWYRLIFYLIPALALALAEYALGEEVTRRALGLNGPLWQLFPFALIAFPLAFKQLLDSEGKPLPRGYLWTLLALIAILMAPLSYLRADQLSGVITKRQGAIGNPFGPSPSAVTGQAASSISGGGNHILPAANKVRSVIPLTITFICFGFIFPMLSGLAFSKGFEMADKGRENRRARKRIPSAQKKFEEAQNLLKSDLAELESSRAQVVKLKRILSDIDLASRILYELQSHLRSLGAEEAEGLAERFEEVRGKGLEALSSKLEEERSKLRERGSDARFAAVVSLYFEKIKSASQDKEITFLDKLAKTKKVTVRSFVQDGYNVGRATAFALLRSYDPEELLRMVDDRKFHDNLFQARIQN